MALAVGVGPAGAQDDPHIKWTRKSVTDPITSKTTLEIQTASDDDVAVNFSCQHVKDGYIYGFIVRINDYLGDSDLNGRETTYRFDQQKTITKFWVYRTNTAQVITTAESKNIIEAFLASERMVIRMSDFKDQYHDLIIFSDQEAKTALTSLIQACRVVPV